MGGSISADPQGDVAAGRRGRAAVPRGYDDSAIVRQLAVRASATRLGRSLAPVLFDHVQTVALAGLAAYALRRAPTPVGLLTLGLCSLWMASRMRGLEDQVHDASHRNWFRRNHRVNDRVANVAAAYPVFLSIDSYRREHRVHHAEFGGPRDPDLKLYQRLRLEELDRSGLWPLLGGLVVRLPGAWLGWWRSVGTTPGVWGSGLLWHGAVLVAPMTLLLGPSWALSVWAVWIGTYLVTLPALRLLVEANDHRFSRADNMFEATIASCGWLNRLFFHPHSDGLHTTHHLWQTVPLHALKGFHRELLRLDPAGYGARHWYRDRVLCDPKQDIRDVR